MHTRLCLQSSDRVNTAVMMSLFNELEDEVLSVCVFANTVLSQLHSNCEPQDLGKRSTRALH